MYAPVNTKRGIEALNAWCDRFKPSASGLAPGPNEEANKPPLGSIRMPGPLLDWLLDRMLLRGVPLCYLVPDARLLPPESIRFFHVDPTWLDRLIDGVFAAADLGTVDTTYGYGVMPWVRKYLYKQVGERAGAATWSPDASPMTGMLIRSDLVRRWPDLVVTAYKDPWAPPAAFSKLPPAAQPSGQIPPVNFRITVLRAEVLSPSVFIVLFAGQPGGVQIREPHVAMRFGVDTDTMKTVARGRDGKVTGGLDYKINWRSQRDRTLDISKLDKDIGAANGGSSMVALQLEQPAYAQDFLPGADESAGSRDPNTITIPIIISKLGKTLDLSKFKLRFAATQTRRDS